MISTTTLPTRKVGTTVVKPIIIGTYAIMFSQQEIARRRSRNDSSTHKWYCIVRAPNDENMSYFIRKVIINLHPTFTNPQRTLEKPPYEVREVGWGEFDITARIYFVDPNERPVELRHRLRLYPVGVEDFERYRPPEGSQNCMATETYDEIFFNDPNEKFYDILINGPVHTPVRHSMEPYFLRNHGKEEYLAAIAAGETTVNKNIQIAKEKTIDLGLEIEKLKEVYFAINEDKAISIVKKESNKSTTATP